MNFCGWDHLRVCQEVLVALDGERPDEPLTLAAEDRILLIGTEHLVALSTDTGRSLALQERSRIARRHAAEHALLFEVASVTWSRHVRGDRFEELVRLLLEHEPGVRRVKPAGSAHEPDGGRDLLVEWETPLLAPEVDANQPSVTHRVRRVIVQCKADARPVGTSRVNGVGDVLDDYGADGYLLVVRSRLTRPLVDRLDRRRAAGSSWIDWWEGIEIERRLRDLQHVASDFDDIVSIVNPDTPSADDR